MAVTGTKLSERAVTKLTGLSLMGPTADTSRTSNGIRPLPTFIAYTLDMQEIRTGTKLSEQPAK